MAALAKMNESATLVSRNIPYISTHAASAVDASQERRPGAGGPRGTDKLSSVP